MAIRGSLRHLRHDHRHREYLGDDLWLSGVRLQPDVDSLLYALAGVNDTVRGWGRESDSERVSTELQAWAGWPWFTLGDLDLGTHLARTGWLREGLTVSEVVARLAARWPLGVQSAPSMTDAEVDTHVITADGRMHFQARVVDAAPRQRPGHRIRERRDRRCAAGCRSRGDCLGGCRARRAVESRCLDWTDPVGARDRRGDRGRSRRGRRHFPDHRRGRRARHGRRLPGRTGRPDIGRCRGVAVRTARGGRGGYDRAELPGLLDAWLMAKEDAALAPGVEAAGLHAIVEPLWMSDPDTSAALATAALGAALN